MTDSKETINRRAMGLGLSLLLLRLPTHAQSTRTVRIGVIRPAPVPVLDVN